MTQETLEEAAEGYSKRSSADVFQENHKKDFINGAKWQQEQDKNKYSEQEVFNMLMGFWKEERLGFKTNPVCVSNWFEQFKKK